MKFKFLILNFVWTNELNGKFTHDYVRLNSSNILYFILTKSNLITLSVKLIKILTENFTYYIIKMFLKFIALKIIYNLFSYVIFNF